MSAYTAALIALVLLLVVTAALPAERRRDAAAQRALRLTNRHANRRTR